MSLGGGVSYPSPSTVIDGRGYPRDGCVRPSSCSTTAHGGDPASQDLTSGKGGNDRLCGGPGCDRDLNLDGSVDQDDVRYLIGIKIGRAHV